MIKKLAWAVKWRARDLESEGCFLKNASYIAYRSAMIPIWALQAVSGMTGGRSSLDDLKQLRGGAWHAAITSMATTLMDVVMTLYLDEAGEGVCVGGRE